ncbi:MAG: hypothetical protein FJZ94_05450 [Chloroflexi bacterium]|nr:hypothetical protein [Chloroflexota bacterium]
MADSSSLLNRMVRAAKLEVNLYEEVEADSKATMPAMWVVIIAAVAAGIGSGIAGIIAGKGVMFFLWGLLGGMAVALLGWLAWAGITYLLGTTVLKGPNTSSTWSELLRTVGFAQSPGVLKILSFIPYVGGVINLGASIWVLIGVVIGVRQALDVSTWRAIAICIVGWLVYFVLGLLLAFLVGFKLF